MNLQDLTKYERKLIWLAITEGKLQPVDLVNGKADKYLEDLNSETVFVSLNLGSDRVEHYHNGCKVKPEEFAQLTEGIRSKPLTVNWES